MASLGRVYTEFYSTGNISEYCIYQANANTSRKSDFDSVPYKLFLVGGRTS